MHSFSITMEVDEYFYNTTESIPKAIANKR